MKILYVDFPILSWGSASFEVDDDVTLDQALEDIRDGIIDIKWNGRHESAMPILSIRDALRDGLGEIPEEIEISE